MTAVAGMVGYLIGSIPTAAFLARLKGIDLRKDGSGNPGAKNALSTGGPVLAAAVLLVEAAKGYVAVLVGMGLADDAGAVAAGLAAVAGNVYNVWYRFGGGKGLGISLGVLAAAWPTVLPVVLVVIVAGVILTRSAGLASLAAMVALIVSAMVWPTNDWPTGGVTPDEKLLVLAVGMSLVMVWKHWRDSPLNPAWRSARRVPASPGRR
ncbi:MAG TPA: glycerol-3-phosphate acyltransferase [Acidimicrobiia bacterium]|jgi:acyl phosphate:glycerol-3-phosphate acyltransferase